MNARETYEKQLEVIKWIDDNFSIPVPGDRRSMMAHSCFDLSIEHHAAMCILFDAGLYGSMFALMRSSFESYIRGSFLRLCATEKELDQYVKDSLKIEFKDLISRIESTIQKQNTPLSKLKDNSWKIFNSFTHTGYQHLVRRNAGGLIGAVNYSETELVQTLTLAGMFAILSSIEIASLANDSKLVESALNKLCTYPSA